MRFCVYLAFLLALLAGCAAPVAAPPTPLPTSAPTAVVQAGPVTVDVLKEFPSAALGNTRTVRVFLPPGYAQSPERRYPVLYLNDGQDSAFLRVQPTLETLYAEGAIVPLIVVAVAASADRLNEYGTASTTNAQQQGARAGAYTTFMLDEVLPAINSRYRTATGPQSTAIAGMSLGGLSAFDLAWNHPDTFGVAGAFSGSFWWRTSDGTPAQRQESRIAHALVRQGQFHPGQRFWFQAGTRDETSDRDGNGVIDAVQDTTELIDELTARGYQRERDVAYLQVEGGEHTVGTWANAMPAFLRWAFPAAP